MVAVTDLPSIAAFIRQAQLDLQPTQQDWVVYTSYDLGPDVNFEFSAYRNHFYEVTLEVTSGCHITIDGKMYGSWGRRLTFVPPYRLQSVRSMPVEMGRGEYFTAFASNAFLVQALGSAAMLALPVTPVVAELDTTTMHALAEVFRMFRADCTPGLPADAELASAYLRLLLAKCKPLFPATTQSSSLAVRAQQLLLAHPEPIATVRQLADALHVSPDHLADAVREATGQRPTDLLQAARLSRAQAMLIQTELTPTEIGYQLGFADASNFFTFFRRLTGSTPAAYRQRHRMIPV